MRVSGERKGEEKCGRVRMSDGEKEEEKKEQMNNGEGKERRNE